MVEINVSYGETRSKNYNSEKHELSINIFLSEEDLMENPVEQWFYFYNNMLKKAVKEMFGEGEQSEIKTIAYETATDTIQEETTIYGSIIEDTEKAYKILNATGDKMIWMPKRAIKIIKEGEYQVLDWFIQKGFKMEWKNA